MSEPTFEDLQARHAKVWAQKQAQAAKALATVHAQQAEMPDVKHAPVRGTLYDGGQDGVQCPTCSGWTWEMWRWNCVNGVRYRMEVRCAGCKELHTWDWGTRAWVA